jgi:SAM-dependent methyltransferase
MPLGTTLEQSNHAGEASMMSLERRTDYLQFVDRLRPFLMPGVNLEDAEGIPAVKISAESPGLRANAHYFGHPKWAQAWFEFVHRDAALRERWCAVAGGWDDRVVVDVGCGPGNLFANLGGNPAALIGLDVAVGSLKLAADQGYTPLLADAHAMPLRSGCADLVALNATLHHCEDMRAVLMESARLVKAGGLIVIDHDPQVTAWDYRGPGRFLWELRKPLYRLMKRGGHSSEDDEQHWAEATEIHHRPGDGLSESLVRSALEPLCFDVRIYPHNNTIGRDVVRGDMGQKPLKYRLGQRLSGIDPAARAGALSLLCVGKRAN